MYDPTIFDNLKVVLEGGLYDLERDHRIILADRQDLLDLARMGRTFRMSFRLPNDQTMVTELELSSELTDFAAELARIRIVQPDPPGCQITIRYRFDKWMEDAGDLSAITRFLQKNWSEDLEVWHSVETMYRSSMFQTSLTSSVQFLRKIDERHIAKLEAMLKHVIKTAERLKQAISK